MQLQHEADTETRYTNKDTHMTLTNTYIAGARTHTHTRVARLENVAELFKIQRNACVRGDEGEVCRLDLKKKERQRNACERERERARCTSQQSARKRQLRDMKRAHRI